MTTAGSLGAKILGEFRRLELDPKRVDEEELAMTLSGAEEDDLDTMTASRDDLLRVFVEIEMIEGEATDEEILVTGRLRRQVLMTKAGGQIRIKVNDLREIVNRHQSLRRWERERYLLPEASEPAG